MIDMIEKTAIIHPSAIVDEGISPTYWHNKRKYLNAYNKLDGSEKDFKANIYGDGTTCKQILENIL